MIRSRLRARLRADDGVVTIIAALLIVVLMASVAFALDLARLRHERQLLQTAVDLGALAGAGKLPVQGSSEANAAIATARRVALGNAPRLAGASLDISFRCVVTDPEGNGGADSTDVRFACGPDGGGGWPDGWTTRRGRAYHACDPFSGEKCNTIVLRAANIVRYFFAPAMGIDQGSTGAVNGASCKGFCGQPSSPLDVVIVIDRSRSMTDPDITNVKNAALSVLSFYDPSLQHVGLVGLPYHQASNPCLVNRRQVYPNAGVWRLVGLSSDYGSSSSQLVRTIQCLERTPANVTTTPSGAGHTDLGDPMWEARNVLLNEGRADVPDVIIFFSDGEANQPRFSQPCSYANTRATAAKDAGINVYTIAYGVASARCGYDTSGSFRGRFASTFFAAMATDSDDDSPGGCGVDENTDGDHFFCETAGSDLESTFRAVAVDALDRSRLIDI